MRSHALVAARNHNCVFFSYLQEEYEEIDMDRYALYRLLLSADPAQETRRMQQNFPCPWCSSAVRCGFCPRLAELLALRKWALLREDADTVAIIDAELAATGIPPPANDNEAAS